MLHKIEPSVVARTICNTEELCGQSTNF